MIDADEFRAFMALLHLAGHDQNETIKDAINGAGAGWAPGALDLWVGLARTIAERAEARGLERGAAAARPSTPPGGGLGDADKATLRTWKGARGKPVPEVVRDEIKRMLRDGYGGVSAAMKRFCVSYDTIKKLRAELDAERLGGLSDAVGAPMPADFLEDAAP